MKTKNIQHWILAALLITVSACKPEIDTPKATAGDADFSKYIAVGNSLTAGFADGGLYLEGQKVAYPNIIASQLKSVGGGDFNSPFFTEAQANGSGYVRLTGFNPDGTPITANVTDKLAYRAQGLLTKYTQEVQNLGVPNMSIQFSDAGVMSSTSGNMYFERLVADADAGSKTYQAFAQGRNHTFFSFWLGNIDVLSWATSGGDAGLDPTKQLTDKVTFKNKYTTFINSLTSNGQKGVVATIPDVTAIPFFNTVTVAAINAGLAANSQLQQLGLTKLYIQPRNGLARLATSEDLIVLNFNRALLGSDLYGVTAATPMENKYVLDKDEVAMAKDYTLDYNNSIKQIATDKGLAFVDTYAVLNRIKTPQIFDGITVSSSFITGNAFSLDGVHLTSIGNAIVANEFIKAINKHYNSNIPTVAVSSYNGVRFP